MCSSVTFDPPLMWHREVHMSPVLSVPLWGQTSPLTSLPSECITAVKGQMLQYHIHQLLSLHISHTSCFMYCTVMSWIFTFLYQFPVICEAVEFKITVQVPLPWNAASVSCVSGVLRNVQHSVSTCSFGFLLRTLLSYKERLTCVPSDNCNLINLDRMIHMAWSLLNTQCNKQCSIISQSDGLPFTKSVFTLRWGGYDYICKNEKVTRRNYYPLLVNMQWNESYVLSQAEKQIWSVYVLTLPALCGWR